MPTNPDADARRVVVFGRYAADEIGVPLVIDSG